MLQVWKYILLHISFTAQETMWVSFEPLVLTTIQLSLIWLFPWLCLLAQPHKIFMEANTWGTGSPGCDGASMQEYRANPWSDLLRATAISFQPRKGSMMFYQDWNIAQSLIAFYHSGSLANKHPPFSSVQASINLCICIYSCVSMLYIH